MWTLEIVEDLSAIKKEVLGPTPSPFSRHSLWNTVHVSLLQIHTRVCLLSEHGTNYMMKASILATVVTLNNRGAGWLFQRWSWMHQQVLSRSAGHPAKGSGAKHCEKSKHCFNLSEKIAWVCSQSSGPFRAQPDRAVENAANSTTTQQPHPSMPLTRTYI